jgi:hypothetical protein
MSRRGAKVMSCHPAFSAECRPLGMLRPNTGARAQVMVLEAGAQRAPMWYDNWRLFLDVHICLAVISECTGCLDGVGADTLLSHLLGYCPAHCLRGLVSAARHLLRWRRWQDAGGNVLRKVLRRKGFWRETFIFK